MNFRSENIEELIRIISHHCKSIIKFRKNKSFLSGKSNGSLRLIFHLPIIFLFKTNFQQYHIESTYFVFLKWFFLIMKVYKQIEIKTIYPSIQTKISPYFSPPRNQFDYSLFPYFVAKSKHFLPLKVCLFCIKYFTCKMFFILWFEKYFPVKYLTCKIFLNGGKGEGSGEMVVVVVRLSWSRTEGNRRLGWAVNQVKLLSIFFL